MIALLLCGALNPPTLAHLRALEEAKIALQSQHLQVVRGILSPVHQQYGKPGLLPNCTRLELCRAAVQDSDWIQVSDWECSQPQYSRTVTVLHTLREQLRTEFGDPSLALHLVCGADLLESLNSSAWSAEDCTTLLTEYRVVCLSRAGSTELERVLELPRIALYASLVVQVHPLVPSFTSSSAVRTLLAQGHSVQYLVPQPVLHLIHATRLYAQHTHGLQHTQGTQ
jgi:nicotinamide mononucleotide adenylyltransferase